MSQKSLLCLLSAVCILMYSEQHFHANCLSSEVVGRKFKGWDHCESLVSVCWPAWVWRNKAVWAAFNYLAVTRPMIPPPPPPPPLPIPPPPPRLDSILIIRGLVFFAFLLWHYIPPSFQKRSHRTNDSQSWEWFWLETAKRNGKVAYYITADKIKREMSQPLTKIKKIWKFGLQAYCISKSVCDSAQMML